MKYQEVLGKILSWKAVYCLLHIMGCTSVD